MGGILFSKFMVPERWYSCLVDKRRGPLSSFVGVFLYVAETTDTEREIKLCSVKINIALALITFVSALFAFPPCYQFECLLFGRGENIALVTVSDKKKTRV